MTARGPLSSAEAASKAVTPPAFAQGLFVLLVLISASPWGSPGVALLLGTALALTLGNPWPASTKHGKTLLQVCVVLLGFGMDLGVVLDAGRRGLGLAVFSIATTLAAGWALGHLLRVERVTSALIAAGTAICGGSAIAAVGSAVGASSGEMAVSMGTVFILNAVALYVFPPLGHLLGLTQDQFGTWAGIAIHDVSSVVGATSAYGEQALAVGTAVKLSRALWIVPLTFAASWVFRGKSEGTKVTVPWFIGLFLLASLARSLVPGIAGATTVVVQVARAGFAVVLFTVGASLSLATLRSVGWRPMVQGVLLWLVISTLALGATLAGL